MLPSQLVYRIGAGGRMVGLGASNHVQMIRSRCPTLFHRVPTRVPHESLTIRVKPGPYFQERKLKNRRYKGKLAKPCRDKICANSNGFPREAAMPYWQGFCWIA